VGWHSTGSTLVSAAKREYGSWRAALLAAKRKFKEPGLDPAEILTRWNWTEEEIIECIRNLYTEHVDLNAGAIISDKSALTLDIIESVIGRRPPSAKSLYDAACYRWRGGAYSGWDVAIRLAGLDPLEIRKNHYAQSHLSLASLDLIPRGMVIGWTLKHKNERQDRATDTETFVDHLLSILRGMRGSERALATALIDKIADSKRVRSRTRIQTLVDTSAIQDVSSLVAALALEAENPADAQQVEAELEKMRRHFSWVQDSGQTRVRRR